MKYLLKKIAKKLIGFNSPKPIHKTLLDKLKENGLTVGTNFNMLPECIIDYSHCWHITIGDDVTLAPRVHILAHDASTKNHLNYTIVKNVIIGNNVFVGTSSIIMPGVSIGDNAIIGAGSVVTKSVPENSVYVGNPAKFACTTSEFIEKQKLKMNSENVFEEAYTLRSNITSQMKSEMIESIKNNGIAFVI
ncbi:DapH/DapD/GlmU-related protein [Flavobacterium sp.]|uniref:acyltransferase n=1 Tax=Flavobacterium sp. TaxID=239 RepID=UPI002869F4E9|nr:DapH/DapD/GlmU-related protein [Flavobacterium sp.]